MIEFRKCYPEHVLLIQAQDAQTRDYVLAANDLETLNRGVSFSGWIDHRCIGAAGVAPVWNRKAFAWALLSKECGPHMVAIAHKARHVINNSPYQRIEATVVYDFAAGHRFAKVLGFELEAKRMRKYDPDGRDVSFYAMVKQ